MPFSAPGGGNDDEAYSDDDDNDVKVSLRGCRSREDLLWGGMWCVPAPYMDPVYTSDGMWTPPEPVWALLPVTPAHLNLTHGGSEYGDGRA